MSAQIMTHTPEQTAYWRDFAISNPGRVARTLVLRPGQTTREGDNQGDIYPALEAVKEISVRERSGETAAWVNLVDAGMADALCKNVCEMVVAFQTIPGMPQELLQDVKNKMTSPYYAPLEVLCNASIGFQYPPTKTNKKVIAALRKNWSEMMERIWNEPENTLRPEATHIVERMVVAQLLLRIIITDPTFISILYEPSDLTIQIIARHWKYAQTLADATFTMSALYLLVEPKHPRQIAYLRSSGLKSTTSNIVSKILFGVGPTTLSSKQQQSKALLAIFAEHLVRLTGRNAEDTLEFLMAIISDASEPELAKAVLKATPLWNAMFRLLKKSAKPTPADDQGPAPQDPEIEKKHRLRIISSIVGTSANILHDASFKHRRECEPLVRIWANENLFGGLEETIDILVTIPGMTMQLSRLASIIDTVVSESAPSTLSLFSKQFPRWKILGTLIKHDVKRQQTSGPPPAPIPGIVAPRDSTLWDHSAWQAFATLQYRCIDKTLCGKRGCANAGTIVCMCKVVKHCSETCKTKDAKDHQLACGWMGLLEDTSITRAASQSAQAASPSVKPTKEKKNSQTSGLNAASPASAKPTLAELD